MKNINEPHFNNNIYSEHVGKYVITVKDMPV